MTGALGGEWLALARAHAATSGVVQEALAAWEATLPATQGGARTAESAGEAARARGAELHAALTLCRALVLNVHPAGAELAEGTLAAARGGEGDLAAALCTAAVSRERVGDAAGALSRLDESLRLVEARGDVVLQLHVRVHKARTHQVLGDRAQAAAEFALALQQARALGDRRAEATVLGSLGFLYGQHDEPEPYAAHTRQALEIFRELGDRKYVALSLCNLGGALQRVGRLDEAAACYDEGLPIALQLGWRFGEALFLAGMGGMACLRHEIDAGIAQYEASNRILEEIGERFQISRHLLIVGRHLVEADRPEAAVPYLTRAVACAQAGSYSSNEAEAHQMLARAQEALGRYDLANASLRAELTVRDRLMRERIEERVRTAELRMQSEAARRDAERERQRAAELQVANEDLRAALERERELMRVLDRLARTDTLTRLANRRHLQEFLAQEMGRSRRRWRPFSLVLLDIDHFKTINDRFGHAVGDEVLVEVGNRLKEALRSVDVVARWGGEEFCAALVDTSGPMALQVAQRLRVAIYAQPFRTSVGAVTVTASLGVADLRPGESAVDELIRRADLSLYEAKRRGRNRVEGGPEHVTEVVHPDEASELP